MKTKGHKSLDIILTLLVFSFLLIGCTANDGSIKHTQEKNSTEQLDQETQSLTNILNNLKEIVTIIGLIVGICLGYPFLRKQLIDNQVKQFIDDIQISNKEIKVSCQKLIDKYISRTYLTEEITIPDIQSTYDEMDELHSVALNATREVTTFVFLFKRTVQNFLRVYDSTNVPYRIYTDKYYSLYIKILQEISFFSTKIISVPKSAKTVNLKYINREIEKFLDKGNFRKFKYFEQGVDHRAASPLLLSFYSNIFNIGNSLFVKSAFKVFNSPVPVVRLLYLYKIYFPPILKKTEKSLFIYEVLYLVGFSASTRYSEDGEKQIITLLYCNISDMVNFTDSITKEVLETKFIDDYINSNGVEIKKAIKVEFGSKEDIKIEFEKNYLHELFNKNRKRIRNKMLSELM
jgi:hypothetical protein